MDDYLVNLFVVQIVPFLYVFFCLLDYFKNEKDSNVEDDIPAKITIIADERSDEELVKNGEWNLVSERKFTTCNNF